MSNNKSKSSVLPSGGGATLIDPSDALILLLDHQSGLFQTVKDRRQCAGSGCPELLGRLRLRLLGGVN